jgi:D-3-phosphoglycerate dehydrogenase / 2-oxoglutarate reductase
MDVLIVEPLEPEVMQWLVERHAVRYAPELARDPRAFRQALFNVRALVIPPSVALDTPALHYAPMLRAVGRVSAGPENIDLDACARAGVEVVRSATASALAEAEFMIGALLAMFRRVPVVNAEGLLVGRELGGTTIGLLGMTPSARSLAQLLGVFGARIVGYDPALHANDGVWSRWHVEPLGLRELIEQCDGVCVQLTYFTRYQGLLGERSLPFCKPNQVMVSIAHSSLFDEAALADVLASGRMAAAWLDSLEPGALDPGRPLHDIESLQITPHVASTTRESRIRSAWSVARRIDELLSVSPGAARGEFKSTSPDDQLGLAAGEASA